ncbi:heat shock protein [Sinobaca qinghaiensis]|uniref:Protease HtpX homolog n=1 Tax=Sinobaca qinghaiensis TaxID=342944 RepID=A0A419V4H7_9BACL|nr:protease HtpX [Sinobaca qinghaiensis]RKD73341.1 heat shock protein [Sinobaca qinghaiensis]
MGRRILLLLVTNILIITTISIVIGILSLFGINIGGMTSPDGSMNFVALLLFSAAFGFGGALISLAISRWMAKKAMGVKVIDPDQPQSQAEKQVLETVHTMARNAGLTHMPEVGIYNSKEVNAFATGPSKKRSLVAVSSGLLETMDKTAVEGVIAHEVAHVANGDMITMTLLQGVVNTFVIFFARIVASVVANFVKDETLRMFVRFGAIIVFQILFSILGSIVVMAFSRYREFHADRGGADLAGRDKMTHALQSLKQYSERVDDSHGSVQTLKINGKTSMAMLFSSHPPLEERIRRLQER